MGPRAVLTPIRSPVAICGRRPQIATGEQHGLPTPVRSPVTFCGQGPQNVTGEHARRREKRARDQFVPTMGTRTSENSVVPVSTSCAPTGVSTPSTCTRFTRGAKSAVQI